MTAEPRRCAVLGSPIQHSLSPALHRAAYAELGLDWSYERYEVGEDGLADFVAGCDASWRGLSLTMPLKVAALRLGTVEPLARQAVLADLVPLVAPVQPQLGVRRPVQRRRQRVLDGRAEDGAAPRLSCHRYRGSPGSSAGTPVGSG